MNDDEKAAIFHRMMRDLDNDDHEANRKPRCDGCGARLPLKPYQRKENGEWLMYCAQCRALAEANDF